MAPPGRNRRGGGKRSRAANRQESTQTLGSTFARPESSQAGGTQTDEAISKAVNVLRVTREANRSIAQACEWLKTQGISDEQLHQAFVQLRDPISKTFKCEMCETNNSPSHFSAKVNFERHITKHASASQSKIVSRDEVLSHWQHLSAENKASMISVVEAKIEAGFGHSVADILQMTGTSTDSSYIPHELMISADRLAIIGTAWASENSEFHLLEFLDACSEGTLLCSDINKFLPPLYLPRLRNLETELTEMFAYYSCYLETELVQSLIILNEGLAKDLIKNEEEELLKKERLKQKTERGNTVQNLPPAAESSEAAATSGDAAEATTSKLDIDFSSVRERFLDILLRFRFSKSKSVTPYFTRQLETMCLFGDLHMPIFYSIVKQQDKGLALIIRDHEKRVHKSLKSALKQFIHDTGYAHRLSINKIELEIQARGRSRARMLARSSLDPARVPSDGKVLVYHYGVHQVLFLLILALNREAVTAEQQVALMHDLFLLPQVIGNAVWRVNCRPLKRSFYVGITALRVLPHVYDYVRPTAAAIGGARYSGEREFTDAARRFFAKAGDVVIPIAAVVLALALVVHAQQRWNYAIVSRMGKPEQKKLQHIF